MRELLILTLAFFAGVVLMKLYPGAFARGLALARIG